jgi:hypothetical protein
MHPEGTMPSKTIDAIGKDENASKNLQAMCQHQSMG